MPRGMTSSMTIRMAKPTTGFQRVLKNSVDHSCARPMTIPPVEPVLLGEPMLGDLLAEGLDEFGLTWTDERTTPVK